MAVCMAAGAAQAGVFAMLAGAFALISRRQSQHEMARFEDGLGTLFWLRLFWRVAMYGPARGSSEAS